MKAAASRGSVRIVATGAGTGPVKMFWSRPATYSWAWPSAYASMRVWEISGSPPGMFMTR